MPKDVIYRSDNSVVSPFAFDEKVAAVFPDMVRRSVPGYTFLLAMSHVITDYFTCDDSAIYDLGCSCGELVWSLYQQLDKPCQIIGIDQSKEMIARCQQLNLTKKPDIKVSFKKQNIMQAKLDDASVVIMNLTLQFIPTHQRDALISDIYASLADQGILVLTEKVALTDQSELHIMEQLHYHMKTLNGYNDLEIARKREALSQVLIPETINAHKLRLQVCGFREALIWWRCFNFVSLIAVK